jgi:hypothetical protein
MKSIPQANIVPATATMDKIIFLQAYILLPSIQNIDCMGISGMFMFTQIIVTRELGLS